MKLNDKIKTVFTILGSIVGLTATILKQKELMTFLKGLSFADETGTTVFIVIIVFLSALIFYLFYKLSKINIDLKKHDFFVNMGCYANIEVGELEKIIPKEKKVFTDLLKIKITSWKNETKKLVDDFYKESFADDQEFLTFILNWFKNSLDNQSEDLKKHNIPLIALNVFDKWHSRRVVATSIYIKKIAYSSKYPYIIRLNSILDYLDNAFLGTISDAKSTIYTLNGNLTGTKYIRTIDGTVEEIIL